MIKEAWIYNEISASLHKEAGETLPRTQRNSHPSSATDTNGKEMEAANRLSQKGWAQAEQKLTQWMQTPLTGNSCSHDPKEGQPASQEGRLIHSSERKGFPVTLRWLLAKWAKCQQSINILSPNSELKILTCKSGFADQKMKGSETYCKDEKKFQSHVAESSF